jgi:hypothetical protein
MSSQPPTPRDAGNWAAPVDRLEVKHAPAEALNLNVQGRPLTGPLRGFGQMWQKTYTVRLAGATVTPQEVIAIWKAEFPNFWPSHSKMYLGLAGVKPGAIGLINTNAPGNVPLMATGVMVIYADDESFSFMTPAGHPFNGMVTFSAHPDGDVTVAQVQVLIRAYDPLYEIGMRLGLLHYGEDQMWHHTLRSLAARFSASGASQQRNVLVDPRVQWSEAKNVWHNSAIRTALYVPVALVKRLIGKQA